MDTIILQNKPRKTTSGNNWTIEVLGTGAAKDAVRKSISALEHHPARAARRSVIDMLGVIEDHNFEVKSVQQFTTDDDLEGLIFVLQR